MNAIDLLKDQHRKAEQLLGELENADDGDEDKVDALVAELSDSLAGHMVIEERLFYPAVREADADLVLESFEEHAVARFALKRLQGLSPSDPRFKARVATLKELIGHHVEEEEEGLFPKAERVVTGDTMEELTQEMQELFEETVSAGFASTYRFRSTASKSSPRAKKTRRAPNGRSSTAR